MTGAAGFDRETLRSALAPTPACATVEELAALREAGSARGANGAVAAHVAGCIRCRTELALLSEFERAAPRPEEQLAARWVVAQLDRAVARTTAAPAPSPEKESLLRRWLPRAALRPVAAGLALAAAVFLVVNLRSQQGLPPALSPEAATGPAVYRSSAVTLLAPDDEPREPPAELRWEPVPGAASYSVTLTEVDRTEVWRAEVREPAAALPPGVLARVVPGKPFLWHVVAKDGGGAVIATSPARRFRIPFGPSRPGR